MATAQRINPIQFLGKTIYFEETPEHGYTVGYTARVVGLQVPCPGVDVEWALLLRRPGYPRVQDEYVDYTRLHFDERAAALALPDELPPKDFN
jgi:hypothetical protein